MSPSPTRSLPPGPAGARLLAALADALQSERRLVEELTALILRQRASVAADDLQGVDDSVFGVQRVLFTLSEARRRRRTINAHLGHGEDITLNELLAALGSFASDELFVARDQLQHAARALAREVAINKQVLREALTANVEMVRGLAGGGEPRVGYGDAPGQPPHDAGPQLINRRA